MPARSHPVVPLVVRRLGAVGAVLALVATPLRGLLACEMTVGPAASASVNHAAVDHAAMGHHDGAPLGASSLVDTDTDTDTNDFSRVPATPDCHQQMGCLVLAEVSLGCADGPSPVPAGAPMPALAVAPEAPAPVVEPPPPRG